MDRRYSGVMIALHWIMAVLMAAAYVVGERFEDMPRGPDKLQALVLHIYVGVAVAALLVPRLLAHIKGAPPLPSTMPAWERIPAVLVHIGLYAVIVVLTVTGLVAITSGRPIPLAGGLTTPVLFARPMHEAMEEAHELGSKAFLLLVAVHVLGALWHVVRRDGLIWRMVPWGPR